MEDGNMKALNVFNYAVVAITGALILFFAITRQQGFIKTLPTMVTLLVMLLNARANRYTFLLGGLNSLVYGYVYFCEGIYFSACSAILMSFPLQMLSFFNWKKHASDKTGTNFVCLSAKKTVLVLLSLIPAWAIAYFGLGTFIKGNFPVLDCYIFVAGILVTVLQTMRIVQSPYINAVSCVLGLVMWGMITAQSPENINYVFISLYNLIMVTEAAVVWTKKYKEQKALTDAQAVEVQA